MLVTWPGKQSEQPLNGTQRTHAMKHQTELLQQKETRPFVMTGLNHTLCRSRWLLEPILLPDTAYR